MKLLDPSITLLTESEVAEIIGKSLSHLRQQRARGVGIPFIKLGASVRYTLEDIIDFISRNRINTTID
jgi:hypothetical protein